MIATARRLFPARRGELAVVAALAVLSVATWTLSLRSGSVTAYNDSMSHLNIARLVFDGRQGGFAQLGTVWLPLGHLLELPLVWNTFLWRTALAGSLVSMAGFVAGGYALFRLVVLLGGRRLHALVGVLAYAVNLNLLYLQTTPLTEPAFVALFLVAVYLFARYLAAGSVGSLIGAGLIAGLGVLDRYDGWFVAAVMGTAVVVNELVVLRSGRGRAAGTTMLFLAPSVFAMVLWFGWNLMLFGDPLYAFIGPGSAHAQQAYIEATSPLYDKGSVLGASRTYLTAAGANVGYVACGLGAAGWVAFLLEGRRVRGPVRVLIAAVLGSVVVFNVLALFLGFSIIQFPGLHPGDNGLGSLFNVRYGVLALPFAAVGAGLLSGFRRVMVPVALLGLALQVAITHQDGVVSLLDGTSGASTAVDSAAADRLGTVVRPGQVVMMSFGAHNPLAFRSGLPLSSFLQEGVSRDWDSALSRPSTRADWVVLASGPSDDVLYQRFIAQRNADFSEHYRLAFGDSVVSVYQRQAGSGSG